MSGLSNLDFTEPDTHLIGHVDSAPANPWQDAFQNQDVLGSFNSQEHSSPDFTVLDVEVTRGLAAEPQEEALVRADREVLLEFDPLASAEERAAREAWADAPGRPPLPPNAGPAHPPGPQPEPGTSSAASSTQNRPSSPIPAFPALAALAWSCSIPSLVSRNQHLRSLDTATVVPSPATISSFAQQWTAPPVSNSHEDRPEERFGREAGNGQSGWQRS